MLKSASTVVYRKVRDIRITGARSICFEPPVAINGFGRIGKLLLRKSLEKDVNVVAVNQPFVDIHAVANALKYDTVHGMFYKNVEVRDNHLCINGRTVRVFYEENPENIKWKNVPVDYVIESSGKFVEKEKSMNHIKAGAKKVIITGPSEDVPTFVRGVNFGDYQKSMQVVSNASGTTNCAAPLLHALHARFGVENCMLTTVHAMTASDHVHDGLNYRSGASNIVPGTTGATTGLGTVVQEFQTNVNGDAIVVPVLNVSLLKLYINISKENLTADVIKEEIIKRTEGELKDVLCYINDKCVSSDFIGCQYSGVVDFNQIRVVDKLITVGIWFDSEMGYSCRVLDLVKHMIKVDNM